MRSTIFDFTVPLIFPRAIPVAVPTSPVTMLPSRFRPFLPPPPLRFPAAGAVFDERLFTAHCKRRISPITPALGHNADSEVYLESLVNDDIHRLVRVTAFRLLVYLRSP